MQADALMQPESRAGYRALVAQGWTDALRTRHPRGGVWTFWDYQAGAWARDAGFRIDHLLLSPQAADRLLDAGVDKEYRGREKASDHAPPGSACATARGSLRSGVREVQTAFYPCHPGLDPGSRVTDAAACNPGCRIKSGVTEEKSRKTLNVDSP
jgi:hypothetical protein